MPDWETRYSNPLDAEKILKTLEKHRVRYIVIGALAATFHGSPLRTDDLDVCPEKTDDNLNLLGNALTELAALEWDPRKDELVERVWSADMLRVDKLRLLATRYGPLDLVFEPAASSGYRDLIRGAAKFRLGRFQIRVAALEDVIRSKEAVNRQKDRHQLPTLQHLLNEIERRKN